MNGVTAIAEILKREKVDFIGCIPSNLKWTPSSGQR